MAFSSSAHSLRTGLSNIPGLSLHEPGGPRTEGVHEVTRSPNDQLAIVGGGGFKGKPLVLPEQRNVSPPAKSSVCVSRGLRWWEKTMKPNMVEIHSAQQLADELVNSGDRLVIVDFYSPGCGGCRTLHPKICQLAEEYPDASFLKVNYEDLKDMCYSLHIHVLPFFRFYRGAEGRVCSFSCTNATIKKFKDAMGKHSTDRCSLGPAKGLDESEILRLASIGQLPMDFPAIGTQGGLVEDLVTRSNEFSGVWSYNGYKIGDKEATGVSLA